MIGDRVVSLEAWYDSYLSHRNDGAHANFKVMLSTLVQSLVAMDGLVVSVLGRDDPQAACKAKKRKDRQASKRKYHYIDCDIVEVKEIPDGEEWI